jgi:phosphopantothenoylcysteine synthetase/decarboxylase
MARSENQRHNSLTPELKGWLDRVIVPALVRQYLAERQPEKSLATGAEPVVESRLARTAIAEEER